MKLDGGNYGYYNYTYPQKKISGGDSIGQFAEKNWNRITTGAAMTGVGAVGLTGACIANTINSNATTFKGTFAQTFPKITKGLQAAYKYSGLQWVTDKATGVWKNNETLGKIKNKIATTSGKVKDWGLKKAKLTKVVDYFKKDGTIGNKIKTSIGGLKETLKTGWKNMSGKNKLIAGIGLATVTAMGLIYGAGKEKAGKIDQKYEDRAKFV